MKRIFAVAAVLVFSGCDGVADEAQQLRRSVAELTVSEIGSLASRIMDDPSIAEEALRSSGLTVERLDSLMYEIATDAEATATYLEALGASGGE